MTPAQPSRGQSWRGRLLFTAAMLAVIIGVVAVALAQPRDPFRADAITDPAFPSLTYGIQAFLWWDGGEVGYNLDLIDMMMFTHVKQTFAWRDLEPEPGLWTWAEADRILDEADARSLQVVARLGAVPGWALPDDADPDATDTPPVDLDTWAAYCGTVAERYRGRIVAYQVWNEPNLSREWGNRAPDAAAYTALLAACSDAIRTADSDAVIISAGLAPTGTQPPIAVPDDVYLQQLYDAGFQRYVDAVGVHAPGFSEPELGPDEAEAQGRGRWATFRRVEDLRTIMVANGDAGRQIAILELGWTIDPVNSDYSWFAVTEAEQADYLARGYAYAAENWRPWVGLMSAIYIAKPVWTEADEEYWWAITIAENGFTRPAVGALAQMPKYCDDITIPERAPDNVPPNPDNPCR